VRPSAPQQQASAPSSALPDVRRSVLASSAPHDAPPGLWRGRRASADAALSPQQHQQFQQFQQPQQHPSHQQHASTSHGHRGPPTESQESLQKLAMERRTDVERERRASERSASYRMDAADMGGGDDVHVGVRTPSPPRSEDGRTNFYSPRAPSPPPVHAAEHDRRVSAVEPTPLYRPARQRGPEEPGRAGEEEEAEAEAAAAAAAAAAAGAGGGYGGGFASSSGPAMQRPGSWLPRHQPQGWEEQQRPQEHGGGGRFDRQPPATVAARQRSIPRIDSRSAMLAAGVSLRVADIAGTQSARGRPPAEPPATGGTQESRPKPRKSPYDGPGLPPRRAPTFRK
jgi:hypothetical protein